MISAQQTQERRLDEIKVFGNQRTFDDKRVEDLPD